MGIDPNGDLCKYLKGVAEAEDVQSYVKDNAFGLPPLPQLILIGVITLKFSHHSSLTIGLLANDDNLVQ